MLFFRFDASHRIGQSSVCAGFLFAAITCGLSQFVAKFPLVTLEDALQKNGTRGKRIQSLGKFRERLIRIINTDVAGVQFACVQRKSFKVGQSF